MLKNRFESFYLKKEDGLYFYDFEKKEYVKLEANPRIILLPDLKERNKVGQEERKRDTRRYRRRCGLS